MAKPWLVLPMLAACSRAAVIAPTTHDGAIEASDPASPRPESAEIDDASVRASSDAAPTAATTATADELTTAKPSLTIATSVEGERVEMREAVAMPMDDGRALVLLRSVERGCTITGDKDEASIVLGMVVRWKAGASTDVARGHSFGRPYAIVHGPGPLADGSPDRRDVRCKAKGTVRVLALPSAADEPARVRFDVQGDGCSAVGEIDLRVCS